MIWADWLVLLVFAVSILAGAVRGAVRELLMLGSWLLAFVVAHFFKLWLAEQWVGQVSLAPLREAIAWSALFLGTLLVCGVVTHFLALMVRDSVFSTADRLTGGGLGLIRAVVIVAAAALFTRAALPSSEGLWQRSALLPWFDAPAAWLSAALPERWQVLLKPAP
jgi:membrane protein required for colicin V production